MELYWFIAVGIAAYAGYLLLFFIAQWFLFRRMGLPGWKGIVPVYNLLELLKVLRKPARWCWIITGSTLMYGLIGPALLFARVVHPFWVVPVMLLLSVGILYLYVLINQELSNSFGYPAWMVLLLLFFPMIGRLVLAFGDHEFERPPSDVEYSIDPEDGVIAVKTEAEPAPAPPEEASKEI